MTEQEKTSQLASIINHTLPQIVGAKCVFLDLPYYNNIGDIMIWEGTEWFLKTNRIKCIYSASKDTFDWRYIPDDVTILLQGGGNFGDLWVPHQEFRLKVISHYKRNKIVVLPQTIYYKSIDEMKRQADILASHPHLVICARDYTSEKYLKQNFRNEVVLLPDMAFCIPTELLRNYSQKTIMNKNLFLKRGDRELLEIKYENYIHHNVEVHDWPSYEIRTRTVENYTRLFIRLPKLRMIHAEAIVDFYAKIFLKRHYLQMGIGFVSQYDYVYTTRLHVAILSTLLGKPITFFDNSYGKNSEFYHTWLEGTGNIQFVKA